MDIKKLLLGTFTWKRLVSSVLTIYVMVCALVFFFAERLIFPYHDSSYDQELLGLDFIQSSDGVRLATRHWPVENDQGMVLYFHGNYEDLGHLDDVALDFRQRGFSVLAMDYRGYGLSQGRATEQSVNDDAKLLYQKALSFGYGEQDIIIVGRSIGSGVATQLATHHSVKALFLISPFTSTFRVMTKKKVFPFDRFDSLAIINQINAPLFIGHGNVDQVIPFDHGLQLYQAHEGQKYMLLIKGVGHNDIWGKKSTELLDGFMSFMTNNHAKNNTQP